MSGHFRDQRLLAVAFLAWLLIGLLSPMAFAETGTGNGDEADSVTNNPAPNSGTVPKVLDVEPTEPTSCCGGKSGEAWHWERFLNGELMEEGNWHVVREGLCYMVTPSKDGGVLKLVAYKVPLPEGTAYPVFEDGTTVFFGINKGVGEIWALQHEPGESWIFQIHDKLFDPAKHFTIGTWQMDCTVTLDGKPLPFNVKGVNGSAFFLDCGGQPRLMYLPEGTSWDDCVPEDHKNRVWVKVPLPNERGEFYGLAYASDTRWTVTFSNEPDKTYSASAVKADPDYKPAENSGFKAQ